MSQPEWKGGAYYLKTNKLFLCLLAVLALLGSVSGAYATAYSPDITLITNATDAITAIVAAAILVFVAAFGWPVARKVYRVAKSVLGAA